VTIYHSRAFIRRCGARRPRRLRTTPPFAFVSEGNPPGRDPQRSRGRDHHIPARLTLLVSFARFRLALIFWLLAPLALLRRLRPGRSGWIAAGRERCRADPGNVLLL